MQGLFADEIGGVFCVCVCVVCMCMVRMFVLYVFAQAASTRSIKPERICVECENRSLSRKKEGRSKKMKKESKIELKRQCRGNPRNGDLERWRTEERYLERLQHNSIQKLGESFNDPAAKVK